MSVTRRPGRSLVAVLAASALIFAACGDDSDESSASPSSEATLPGESAAGTDPPDTEAPDVDPATTAPSATAPATTAAAAAPAPTTSSTTSTLPEWTLEPVAADVEYAPMSEAQKLDLYLPDAALSPLPLVVFIHGGAWMAGDKRNVAAASVIPVFLDEGYAVASINYRLSGEAIFPAQLLDVKAAIRWLRANAGTYGFDPDRIAAAGESAGAHLAALLGTSAGVAEFDDPAYGNAEVSSAVNAVLDWYGPVDLVTADVQLAANPACADAERPPGPDPASSQLLGAPPDEVPELAATANPITYLQPDRIVPPFLIEHGDVDCVVPYQGSVALHEAIEAFAGPGRSQLVIVPGSGHYTSFDGASQVPTVLAFLASTVGAKSG